MCIVDVGAHRNGVSQGVELRHNDGRPGKLLLCLLGSSLVPADDLNQRLDLRDHGDRVDAAHLFLAQPASNCGRV